MGVPYTFADALGGSNLPLEWLDDNFAYLTGSPEFYGNVTISGTLNVLGVTTLSNAVSIAGPLTIGSQQSAQGSLVLANTSAGAYSTTIKSSNFSSTAWTFTLPPTAGTNGYILTTDGFGFSAWTNPTALGIDLDVGSTAITAGATGRVLYDNAGVLGEYSLVPLSVGGTNANLTASNGGIFYSTASAAAILAGTATANQLLISGSSSAPSWTTATYPPTTTINQILYSSANNTVTGLATANGGMLNANSSGVPSMTVTPTLGVQQTTQGRLILANTAAGAFQTTIQSSNSASAAWTLTLPTTAGTNNYVLTTNGSGVSSWSQVSLTAGVTGILPIANGGTGISSLATGRIPFGGATTFSSDGALFWDNVNKRLGIGTATPSDALNVIGSAAITGPLFVGPETANPSVPYQGIKLQNGVDSGPTGIQTRNYIDARNNISTADSTIYFIHNTDGSSELLFETTPAGSRSSDRRVPRVSIDSNGRTQATRTAASAGFALVAKSASVSNESGIYFDGSNNAQIDAKNASGVTQIRWQTANATSNLVAGLPAFVCRAWVNFDGTTITPSIRGSGNVSSITDNGTGNYSVNLTTPMPDVNAAVVSSCEIAGPAHENTTSWMEFVGAPRVETRDGNTPTDALWVSVAVFT